MLDFFQSIDEYLFLVINGFNSEFFDAIMYWISGKYSWLPFYLLIIGMLIFKFRLKTFIILLVIALLITASDQASVHLFKNVFERLRPCHNPELKEFVHLVRNHCGGKYGFISSHAANSFALMAFLIPLFNRRWFTIIIISWAIIVGYSRIYLGVHYPFDILVGAAFGSILGYGFVIALKKVYLEKPLA